MRTVLNISKHAAIGRRFNNLDAREYFLPNGWDPLYCSWTASAEPREFVVEVPGKLNHFVTRALGRASRFTGDLNGFYRNAKHIAALEFFKRADLLHFHIVHEKWLSIHDWLKLAEQKPVVWTWHDPYMMTGHCIYPMQCRGFESGCIRCPHLDYHFPIKVDRSAENLREKVEAVTRMDPLVVVASDFMSEMVDRSLYSDKVRKKIVPFGVELRKHPEHHQARTKLGLPTDRIVFGFRAVYSAYKGMDLIQSLFARLAKTFPELPITVIAFQEKGCCVAFSGQYQVIETGWIEDGQIYEYFAAMDYFLMPSRAEAFGMMAIEAMATGACPIVTYGTALTELIGAPRFGISVKAEENELYECVLREIISGLNRTAMQREARIGFATQQYSLERFSKDMANTYDEEHEYRASVRRPA